MSVIGALTLDLDDTLWAIAPVILRAEAAQHAYLSTHCPRTAERYTIEGFRVLRETVARERVDLSHDFTEQRLIALRRALEDSGDDIAHAGPAFEIFFAQRNRVDLYDDVRDALGRLSARRPLAALTNGNADLGRVGLDAHFRFSLGAREHGAPKPQPSIFHAACERLGLPPRAVMHVGDDPWLDIDGAARAGLATCWINRTRAAWPDDIPRPDVEVQSLADLADHLDATLDSRACLA